MGGGYSPGSSAGFQSLSGFLMRCDGIFAPNSFAAAMFQSLSGFLMRCDEYARPTIQPLTEVSIPIGFSDAL